MAAQPGMHAACNSILTINGGSSSIKFALFEVSRSAMPCRVVATIILFVALALCSATAAQAEEDHRAWQHGIDLIRVGERLLLVWGSAGNPPRPNLGGDWPHDVYYAWLDPSADHGHAPLDPQTLVSRPEAQEPPSVAINARGTILMTSEDGNGGINQHASLWDSSLRVLRAYPITIRRGGHSGHVAALGERFLVVYGEGWVNGAGWRGLGTGERIYARVVGADGTLAPEVKLTPDGLAHPRDSWPLVAGSERNWLAVWQRYPELTLQSALIGASGAVMARRQIATGLPLRYAYAVDYAPQLAAYVVAGTSGEAGFASLLNLDGDILRTAHGLPPMASESRIVLGLDGTQPIGVYPVRPRGVAVIRFSREAIDLVKVIDHPHVWDYAGTTGLFVAPGKLLFATLSTSGLQLISIDLHLRD